jgi:hypothetical protein
MAVKDQQDGPTALIGESPPLPELVGQVDARCTVPGLHGHVVAPPR